ncbi:MAG: toll/interleukin-1 receptor domain-containing protein [Blastocatellales bacterium]
MRKKTVIISYNHGDSEVAEKLKVALEKNDIEVLIDNAAMYAGANIQQFIEDSIRNTDVTISLVSKRSLLSAWVAMESITAMYGEKLRDNKKFIHCYIDDDFFEPGYRLEANKTIDAQIDKIDKLIPEYIAGKLDPIDLNSEKSRLIKLRNNLGDILLKLKESLTLDIREPAFDESVSRIVISIKAIPGP